MGSLSPYVEFNNIGDYIQLRGIYIWIYLKTLEFYSVDMRL